MNVYDFDNTIYDGESLIDFFLFCIKKSPKLIIYMPKAGYYLYKYKENKLTIKEVEEYVSKVMNKGLDIGTYKNYVGEFWEKNAKKIKPEFLKLLKEDDLIITGCPDFLFEGIKDKIIVKNILCSKFDFKAKKIETLCLGENKVTLLNKFYKEIKIKKFYTDSLMDEPLMKLAEEVYLVEKNIKRIK